MANSQKNSIGDKAAKASFFLLAGVFYSRIINMLTTILLARLLVPADFGLVALATTLLLMVNAMTELSLGSAMIHHKELTQNDFDTAFTLNLMRNLLISAVMVVAGFVMAEIYNDPRLTAICAGLALRPFVAGFGSPRYVLYAKELQFGTIALQEGLNYTAQLIISVLVAYYTRSYWAIVAGAVLASVVGTIMTYIVAPYIPRLSFASSRKILGFSVWLTLNQILTIVGNRFEGFIAGGSLGLSVFGAYSVGNNMAGVINQSAIQPIQRVLFPGFSKIQDDRDRLRQAFQKGQATLFAFGFAVGIGTALVAEPFIYLALGPNWSVAVIVMQTISPVLGAQIVFGPTNALANALGATRMLFNRSLILVLARIPIVLVGLLYYGMPGLLIARFVMGGIITSIVNFYVIRSLIGFGPWEQFAVTWRSWISGFAMAAACLAVRYALGPVTSSYDAVVMLAIQVPLGAFVYCSVHVSLWLAWGRSPIGIEPEIVKMSAKALGWLRHRRGKIA
ncbi:lipopolysaccharide biosynthesis protein [Rhizobium acaciae]|uniref:lipopolysaccharide biosynthesis protein n=1 Tax=Rhizobium acaciae TaxID=2989736 RepID=UPI003F9DE719